VGESPRFLAGCLALLVENVLRAARKRAG